MSEMHRECEAGYWAERNPGRCPCRGQGWWASNYDAWYKCPYHWTETTPHPEDDYAVVDPEQREKDRLEMLRGAYRYFRREARSLGVSKADFDAECRQFKSQSPQEWVDAAEDVYNRISREAHDLEAQKAGYSCALERRWALQAEMEHRDNGWGYY